MAKSSHTEWSTVCKKGLKSIEKLPPCVLSAQLMARTLHGCRLCSGDLWREKCRHAWHLNVCMSKAVRMTWAWADYILAHQQVQQGLLFICGGFMAQSTHKVHSGVEKWWCRRKVGGVDHRTWYLSSPYGAFGHNRALKPFQAPCLSLEESLNPTENPLCCWFYWLMCSSPKSYCSKLSSCVVMKMQ